MAVVFKQGKLFNGGKRSIRITGDGHSEHQHQVALVTWARDSARLQTDDLKRLALEWFHAIPNGAFLGAGKDGGKQTAARLALKLKAEGLTPGIWDLRLDYVKCDSAGMMICPGLIIEMKRPGEKLSKEQIEYGKFMGVLGFNRFIAQDWQQGAYGLVDYLELDHYAPIYPKR